MTPDTSLAYGTVSRALHWLMAAALLFMLISVILPKLNEDYYSLMDYHKLCGYSLFFLMIFRIVWSVKNRRNRPQNTLLAKLGHVALYLLLLLVPAIGLLRQYGSARGPLEWGGLTLLPTAPERIEWMTKLGGALHGELGWLLFALIGGHIAAAVIHQIKGDKIINRIIGPRR